MSSEPQASAQRVDRPRSLSDWIFTPAFLFRAGLLLVLALYLRTLTFDFVYDDLTIPVSPWIQSWHGIVEAFQRDIFGAASGTAGSAYYRPLAAALGILVARVASPTPAWYHLIAILIEIVVYTLSYQFGRLLFKDDLIAALTAVLFALHPTKIETITWIGSSLCDGQAGVYFFATLIAYLRWWDTRKPGWLAGSAAFFLLAMFTKETMVVVPVLIAVHCLLRSDKRERVTRTAAVVLPYVLVVGVYMFARHAALGALPKSSIAVRPEFTIENLWSTPLALWWYVKQAAAPFRLSILHDWSTVTRPSLALFVSPVLGAILLVGLLGWIWRRTGSWRVLFFAAWFLLTLGPVIALSPSLTVHDRYLQLAVYPLCAALSYGLVFYVRQTRTRVPAIVLGVAIAATWSAVTWYETGFWDNSIALWQRAVQVAPHSVNARVELARLYSGENDTPAAIAVLDDGLRLLPNSPGLWRMRGGLQFNAGNLEESRQSLLHALEASKRFRSEETEPTDVRYGRASAAFLLGQIEMLKGNPAAADPWLRMALEINPEDPDYRSVMAANLRRLGRAEEAEPHEKSGSATAPH